MSTIENVIEKIYEYSLPAIVVTAVIVLLFAVLTIAAPKRSDSRKIKVTKVAVSVLRFFDAIWFAILASSCLSYLANVFLTKSGNTMFYLPAADAIKGIAFLSLIGFCIASLALSVFRTVKRKLIAAQNT